MGDAQSNGVESEYPSLSRLRRAVLLVLGVISVVGSLLVGLTPGGWDAAGGLFVAFATGYIFLQDEIERYLTDAQEWATFALFGTVCVTLVVVLDGELSVELALAYVACLAVSGLFGYRAKAAA